MQMQMVGHRTPLLRAAIFGRWRLAWTSLIVMVLLLNAATPMLAAAAAQWQGRAIAEICSVYGVDLVAERARNRADAGIHSMTMTMTPHPAHVAGAAPSAHDWQNDLPDDRAAPPAGHGQHDPHHDAHHCALTGVAVGAMLVVALLIFMAWTGTRLPSRRVAWPDSLRPDASARWLGLRLHAPPRAVR